GREARRIERGAVVRTDEGRVERQVFLDDGRAARRGGDGDVSAERVVGEADRAAESDGQRVHGAQVDLAGRRGIRGEAVQHGQRRIARGADGGHRLLDLLQARHAGREDDGAALGRYVSQQREIRDLAGRDLEEGDAERLES